MFQDTKEHKRFKKLVQQTSAIAEGHCQFCGNDRLRIVGEGITICPSCSKQRYITSLTKRFVYARKKRIENHVLVIGVSLTNTQHHAAKSIMDYLTLKEDVIMRAVCGAGKTEIVMPAIFASLKSNLTVGYIVPRIAIAKQLKKRFNDAFPQTSIGFLGGGETHLDKQSFILVILQRLWHFTHEFDLLIVDESDAFPLKGNLYYKQLIQRSLTDRGRCVFMSATGQKEMVVHPRKNTTMIDVNRRYHGHVLDVPEYVRVKKLNKRLSDFNFPDKVRHFIDDCLMHTYPLFLFVPTKKSGHTLNQLLKDHKYESCFISAETDDKERVFKHGREVIVTTTVLERGVTFTNLWVGVMMADHPHFDSDTLIQIAGRVGRKATAPHGRILFFARTMSRAMDEAMMTIRQTNKEKNDAL